MPKKITLNYSQPLSDTINPKHNAMYTLEIRLDYIENLGDPVDVTEKTFEDLNEAVQKAVEIVSQKSHEHGCYQYVCVYQGTEDDPYQKRKYEGYSESAELPENGVLVFYKHRTYMNYAYKITGVEPVGGRFNTYEDLPFSDDHTSATHCNVYDTVQELHVDYKNKHSIFAKLQSGSGMVVDYLISNGNLKEENE